MKKLLFFTLLLLSGCYQIDLEYQDTDHFLKDNSRNNKILKSLEANHIC